MGFAELTLAYRLRYFTFNAQFIITKVTPEFNKFISKFFAKFLTIKNYYINNQKKILLKVHKN